jgi:hypothetical protein
VYGRTHNNNRVVFDDKPNLNNIKRESCLHGVTEKCDVIPIFSNFLVVDTHDDEGI